MTVMAVVVSHPKRVKEGVVCVQSWQRQQVTDCFATFKGSIVIRSMVCAVIAGTQEGKKTTTKKHDVQDRYSAGSAIVNTPESLRKMIFSDESYLCRIIT